MDEIIRMVKTFRVTAGLAERFQLPEAIFRLIDPDLRFFVFKAIRPPAADEVLQEVLKATPPACMRQGFSQKHPTPEKTSAL